MTGRLRPQLNAFPLHWFRSGQNDVDHREIPRVCQLVEIAVR